MILPSEIILPVIILIWNLDGGSYIASYPSLRECKSWAAWYEIVVPKLEQEVYGPRFECREEE